MTDFTNVINIPHVPEGGVPEGIYFENATLVDENGVEYLAEFEATDELFQDTDTPDEYDHSQWSHPPIDTHFGEETEKGLFQKLEEAFTPTIH